MVPTETPSDLQRRGAIGYLSRWRVREHALRQLSPSPLERTIKRYTVVGVVALAVLNAADTVTTKLILAKVPAGAQEANPIAQLLLSGRRLLFVKLVIVALLGMAVLRDRPRLGLLIGVSVVVGFYATAVVSNVLILRMY